jgi:dTDP-4-dehydrorhamnose reductase
LPTFLLGARIVIAPPSASRFASRPRHMKILLTGAQGQIGHELARRLRSANTLVAFDRTQLDLADADATSRAVRAVRPDLIINAAAHTAVDRAEREPELAFAINAVAPEVLAAEAARARSALIHYSTDYVFDGTKTTPYRFDDPPNPQSVYGRSKLAGEQAVLHSGASAVILRTGWVYAMRGRNFLLAILRQIGVKDELRVVNDQRGCPNWAGALAQATIDIIAAGLAQNAGETSFGKRGGVHHLSCAGEATWFDFAARILELRSPDPMPRLVPVSTNEFPALAARPRYSVLDCSRTVSTFGLALPQWTAALEQAWREQPPFPSSAA